MPIAEAVVKQTQNRLFPPRSLRRARTGTVAVLRGARLRPPWVMGSTVHGALAGAWLLRHVLVLSTILYAAASLSERDERK